jgi:hypothetical protein
VIRAAVIPVAVLLGTAAPAAATSADDTEVRLRTTAEFAKPAYDSTDVDPDSDNIRFTVTIENIGTVTAEDVDLAVRTDLVVDNTDLGPLFGDAGTVRLAPGERFSIEVPVRVWYSTEELRVQLDASAVGQRYAEGSYLLTAPMTLLRGSVSGIVYGDVDGDEVVDAGEELVGGTLDISGGFPNHSEQFRVGAGGVFTMPDLPAGGYTVNTWLSPGWRVATPTVHQVAGGSNTWLIRAVRDVKPALSAAATFDRDTYTVGDAAREHVVLTNTGTTTLSGVRAVCGGDNGDLNNLYGRTWGDLTAEGGAGVPLRPGERRTFDFTEIVPPQGAEFGFVVLSCQFFVGDVTGPVTTDRAGVPGLLGTVTGQLCMVDSDPCGPVAGVHILLLDTVGRVVVRTVTAPDGHYRFTDMPAGSYEIRFVGPWRHPWGPIDYLQIFGGMTSERRLDVRPGPNLSDPQALPQPTPSQQASPRPANLADTGVSAVELTTFGALLLLTGAALALAGRRRTG